MSRALLVSLLVGLWPVVGSASPADHDDDGLTDLEELLLGTSLEDADSDGDGLPDGMEVPDPSSPRDTDDDGLIDALDDDDDDDGIPTWVELGDWDASMRGLNPPDTDLDGLFDPHDLDSDDDGHPDALEGAADVDGDGLPNSVDLDSDGDSLYDLNERDYDSDGDGLIDLVDMDDDGDGIPTIWEYDLVAPGQQDLDGDGLRTWLDEDSDGDGVPDAVEGVLDADCDGRPNFIDWRDDDGPCVPTFQTPPSMRSGPGAGCATVNTTVGATSLFVVLFVLGLRRRGQAP